MQSNAFTFAADLGFKSYSHGIVEDGLLLRWQEEMLEADEFLKIFQACRLPISNFLSLFSAPNILFYLPAPQRIRYAMWLSPNWYGADIGVWIEPELRHASKGSFGFALGKAIWSMAFSLYNEIGGITSEIEFLKRHEKDGLRIVGKYPVQMNGFDKWRFFFPREEYLKGAYNLDQPTESRRAVVEDKEVYSPVKRPTTNDLLE